MHTSPILVSGAYYQGETSHLYIQIHATAHFTSYHLLFGRPQRPHHHFTTTHSLQGRYVCVQLRYEMILLYSKWGTKTYGSFITTKEEVRARRTGSFSKPKRQGLLMGVAYIVLRDNRVAECACACSYEPLYWNAGPGHSAAHSFNFCKQTNSRRLEDHTASLVKH